MGGRQQQSLCAAGAPAGQPGVATCAPRHRSSSHHVHAIGCRAAGGCCVRQRLHAHQQGGTAAVPVGEPVVLLLPQQQLPASQAPPALWCAVCAPACSQHARAAAPALRRAAQAAVPCSPTACMPTPSLPSPPAPLYFPWLLCRMQRVFTGSRLPGRQPGCGAGRRMRHPHSGLPVQGQRAGGGRLCLLSGRADQLQTGSAASLDW